MRNNMDILSLTIFISAIVLLVVLSYRGLGQVVAPIICVALVSLISKAGFIESFFVTFPQGAATFVVRMLLPVMSGSVLGEMMSASGSGQSIGKAVTRLLGKDNAPYVIMITSFIVALSGMNSSIFAIAALSHVVMKEADLPSYIGMVSFLSIKEVTGMAMPGLPYSGNLLPTTYLGTDLYAGAVPGIIAMLFGWSLTVVYVKKLVKQARAENKGYENFFVSSRKDAEGQKTPSVTVAVLPFSLVLVLTFVLQKVFSVKASVAAFSTQVAAILMMMITCRKYFNVKIDMALTSGVKRGAEFIVPAACLVGFASVAADTSIFESIQIFLFSLKMDPYLFTFVAVSLLAAISCDATSAMIMFFQTFTDNFLGNSAVNLGYIHRIAAITCTGFDSLPQGGMCLLTLKTFGYDHKSGYKYFGTASLLIPFLSGAVCTAASMILA